jgi:uncharacterized protein YegL
MMKMLIGFLTALALALIMPAGPAAGQDRNNVVIVLDASGSMNEALRGSHIVKMAAAKAALKEVLKQVPADTQIGLLVFSAVENRNGWLYPLGPRDDTRLMRAIDVPIPGGHTPLGRFIKIGADRLLEERRRQFGYGSFRLLVVTDGEANDPELVERHVPEVIARGITLDVIGVDMAKAHTLATRVHSYRRADNPESLKRAIAEVFAELADTGTDSATAEAFDILSGIPDETAAAMLGALAASGNHPIAEAPSPAVAPPVPKPPAPAPAPSPPPKAPPQKAKSGWEAYLLVPAAIILAVILRRLRRRESGNIAMQRKRRHGR